jgi:hypothetical protein
LVAPSILREASVAVEQRHFRGITHVFAKPLILFERATVSWSRRMKDTLASNLPRCQRQFRGSNEGSHLFARKPAF